MSPNILVLQHIYGLGMWCSMLLISYPIITDQSYFLVKSYYVHRLSSDRKKGGSDCRADSEPEGMMGDDSKIEGNGQGRRAPEVPAGRS